MCGIYGIWGSDPERHADRVVLDGMGRSLLHRGPDGGGLYVDGALAIGMRRLSIIDLKTGDQPIANEDGSIWVVFNGEIYNYRELTNDLIAAGHRFVTASDTEVLVHLYEEYGVAGVRRLRGMFAYAVWDRRRRRLLLARDRFGIKPLYYAHTPSGFVFGSELKALIQSRWVGPEISGAGLAAYLHYGYVPEPLSILRNIRKVPAAHAMIVDEGRPQRPRPYWDVTQSFRLTNTIGEREATEELRTRLDDAVTSHLVADVPVGAFLSGGVDSSAVVAIMARKAGARVKTFSVGFSEPQYNELPHARAVAEAFGTDHYELIAGPEDLSVLDEVLAAVDEPFADASAIPTYLVSRLAREHVKVVLSGDGGDEIFAGYDRYVVDYRRRHLGVIGDAGLGGPLRMLSRLLPEGTPGKNYLYNMSLPRLERYLDAIALFPTRAVRALLDTESGEDDASFREAIADGRDLDRVSQLQHLDIKTYLPGDILTKVDRMTMANSLEARVPLLDHGLVEFAASLPPDLRLRGAATKYALKRALNGHVPEEVLVRPKQGFGVPLEAWFSYVLPEFFEERLGRHAPLSHLGIKASEVRRLLDRFRRGRRQDHCRRLWALVVLDASLRRLWETAAR